MMIMAMFRGGPPPPPIISQVEFITGEGRDIYRVFFLKNELKKI